MSCGKRREERSPFLSAAPDSTFFPRCQRPPSRSSSATAIDVYFPEQQCCGMPSLLEGDQQLTFEFAAFNMERLAEAVERRLRHCVLLPDLRLYAQKRPERGRLLFRGTPRRPSGPEKVRWTKEDAASDSASRARAKARQSRHRGTLQG